MNTPTRNQLFYEILIHLLKLLFKREENEEIQTKM